MDEKSTKMLFRKLITKFGDGESIEVFYYCFESGVELDNSTIDKIELCGDDIRFYYNENENDYDHFDRFALDDLSQFAEKLFDCVVEAFRDTCEDEFYALPNYEDYADGNFDIIFNEYKECFVDNDDEDMNPSLEDFIDYVIS